MKTETTAIHTEHTSGTWHERTVTTIHNSGCPEEVIELGIVETDETIGYVHKIGDFNLIVAAPDLLEALEDLTKSCANWAPTIDRSRAKAAIRKAKGEQ